MLAEPAQIIESVKLRYTRLSRRLENGLKVVEVRQPHLHRGSIAIYFRTGSRYESRGENGLSHFLEHMVFRGTRRHPSSYQLNLAVERLGGTLYAATSPDATEFQLSLPSESLAAGAALLADVVTCPVFRDIEIERRVVEEEIREDLDEDGNPIDIDFLSRRRLWPDHPLGQSVTGPVENVQRFGVDDVRGHLERHYVAGNGVLCLTGAYEPDEVLPVVERAFSAVPSGLAQSDGAAPRIGEGPAFFHAGKPGSQTQLRLSYPAPGGRDPDRIALAVLLGVLDDGMSARLHRRIFDELGLAYNVSADAELYSDAGALSFDAASTHGNVARIIDEIGTLVTELRDGPVDADELDKAKKREVWGLESFLDGAHAMSSWYGEQRLHWKPLALEERIERVRAVTRDDLRRVASRIFDDSRRQVVTVGVLEGGALEEVERAALGGR